MDDLATLLGSSPFAAEARAAATAARAGGAEVMARYGAREHTLKDGGSPVTAADHAASAVIDQQLRAAFAADPILCEETADDAGRRASARVWIVDPLDGTREFLAGNGEFSVMVGLAVDGRATVGAVYRPASDVLYVAARDAGAYRVSADGIARLHVARAGTALRLVTSRSHADHNVERVAALLPIAERRPSGSVGLKCALIAEGACDLYVHPVPYMGEWDTCAPEVILTEAGGSVTDCNGARLRYNKADTHQPAGILACGAGVFERMRPHLGTLLAHVPAAGTI